MSVGGGVPTTLAAWQCGSAAACGGCLLLARCGIAACLCGMHAWRARCACVAACGRLAGWLQVRLDVMELAWADMGGVRFSQASKQGSQAAARRACRHSELQALGCVTKVKKFEPKP